MAVAVYPGSFDPLTVAHVAVARAAVDQRGAERVVLAVSTTTLGTDHLDATATRRRVDALRRSVERFPRLGVVVTEASLVVDIADGYDLVVMGADKWAQVNDPAWYGGVAERDAALRRLPAVAVAPRAGFEVPPELALELPGHLAAVSASAVRRGRNEWAADRG